MDSQREDFRVSFIDRSKTETKDIFSMKHSLPIAPPIPLRHTSGLCLYGFITSQLVFLLNRIPIYEF